MATVAVGGGLGCQFESGGWLMTMPGGFFGAKPAVDRMISVAATVYHESRHAEQYFNMARMLAGQGKTAQEISSAAGRMDPTKVALAMANPMAPNDPKVAHYQQMLTNLNDPANVQLVQTVKQQKGPVEAAAQAWQTALVNKDPNEPALNAQFKSLMAAFTPLMKRYNALDAEADALAIEDKVKALWP